MLLKAFTTYTVDPDKMPDLAYQFIAEKLAEKPLHERSKTQKITRGFMPICPLPAVEEGSELPELTEHEALDQHNARFIYEIDGCRVFKLGVLTAALSTKALGRELDAAKTEHLKNHPDLVDWPPVREAIEAQHLADAKSELTIYVGYLDTRSNRLIIGTTGGKADDITDELRNALGGLPVSLLRTEQTPSEKLTRWAMPHATEKEKEDDTGPKVTPETYYKYQAKKEKGEKVTPEIIIKGDIPWGVTEDDGSISSIFDFLGDYSLIEAGLDVAGRCTIKLDDKWVIKNMVLSDVIREKHFDDQEENMADGFAVNLFMDVAEIRVLLDTLIPLFGGLAKPLIIGKGRGEGETPKDENGTVWASDLVGSKQSLQEWAGKPKHTEHIDIEVLEKEDGLFSEAEKMVRETRKCSISSIQRKLRIGYNRAARLVELLERAGVVSSPQTNGGREVLLQPA